MAAFPNIPTTDLVINSNTPTIVTKSLSGKEQRTQVAGQYFDVVATYSNLSEANRKLLQGFIASNKGSLTPFTLTFPTDSNIGNSSAVSNYTVTIASAGAGAVTVTGTTTANVTVLKAGDVFKFSGHDKVYMATADATSSGTNISISFFPPLRQAIATSNTVTHKSVPMTVRIADDVTGFSMDQTLFSTFSLKFVEVF